MEVRINKKYELPGESILRAVPAAVAVRSAGGRRGSGRIFRPAPCAGNGEIGWACVLAAFPFALGGFFQYNGMTLERFLLAYIRSEFLFPRRLVFRSDNIYANALENSTIKEALKLD